MNVTYWYDPVGDEYHTRVPGEPAPAAHWEQIEKEKFDYAMHLLKD